MGIEIEIDNVDNPRVELEEHYYNPVHTKLLDLGLQPSYLGDELVHSMLKTIERHRDRVIDSAIDPKTRWRPASTAASRRASQPRCDQPAGTSYHRLDARG